MIKCNLSAIMGIKKLNKSQLSVMTGINRNSITELYYDKAERFDKKTLNALCKALGVKLTDLLQYVEDEDTEN